MRPYNSVDLIISAPNGKKIAHVNKLTDMEVGEVAKPEAGTIYYLRHIATKEIVMNNGSKAEVQAIERHGARILARIIDGGGKRFCVESKLRKPPFILVPCPVKK